MDFTMSLPELVSYTNLRHKNVVTTVADSKELSADQKTKVLDTIKTQFGQVVNKYNNLMAYGEKWRSEVDAKLMIFNLLDWLAGLEHEVRDLKKQSA